MTFARTGCTNTFPDQHTHLHSIGRLRRRWCTLVRVTPRWSGWGEQDVVWNHGVDNKKLDFSAKLLKSARPWWIPVGKFLFFSNSVTVPLRDTLSSFNLLGDKWGENKFNLNFVGIQKYTKSRYFVLVHWCSPIFSFFWIFRWAARHRPQRLSVLYIFF
jgi:hypothetical protein